MRLRTIISIPREATLADVNDVVEFLTGLGSATADFRNWKIVAEFEPLDQPVMDVSAAIVDHTAQAAEAVVARAITGFRPSAEFTDRLRGSISAGLGLLDRWDEIQTELASRGWDRPSWEIR